LEEVFSAKLGMYVTAAVLTACWKQSVNASYNRRDVIGRASNYIAKQYNDYNKKDLVEVTQETLVRRGTYPNHFDPLVHLSSCIDNANLTDMLLWDDGGVPDALLVDIVLGSVLYTTNITRFDIFYKSVLDSWQRTGSLPLKPGDDLLTLYFEWL
jgi:hypothetical protein